MIGLQIAALIDRSSYAVKLYHEEWHGPYCHTPHQTFDVVFLSGLQKDFDRMRQLSFAFQRAGSLVVAGGSVCTLFPEYCTQFFDIVCAGGVDAVADIMRDFESGFLRTIYRSPNSRYLNYRMDYRLLDEAGICLPVHLVEASRGCTFRCDFCTIPAERAGHRPFGIQAVADAIDGSIAASPKMSLRRRYPMVWFLDNNLGNDPDYLNALCSYMRCNSQVRAWGGLVTQNILRDHELVRTMAASKCRAIFSGVESFDENFLRHHNKKQNISRHSKVVEDIAFVQRQGIQFSYGYMFDPRITSVANMRREIEFIVDQDPLPFPSFFGFISPLAGTQVFWDCADRGSLLGGLLLRDMDGETIAYSDTWDSPEALSEFARVLFGRTNELVSQKRLAFAVARSIACARELNPMTWYLYFKSNFRSLAKGRTYSKTANRTYIAGSDCLDPQYFDRPTNLNGDDRIKYFDPVKLTATDGGPVAWLEHYRPAAKNKPSAPSVESDRLGSTERGEEGNEEARQA